MTNIKCKRCGNQWSIPEGESAGECKSCGSTQLMVVPDEATINAMLDQGFQALKKSDWTGAEGIFDEVLGYDSANARANLGKMLAVETCTDMDAFIQKRKHAYGKAQTKAVLRKSDASYAQEIVQKYALPGYVDLNAMRSMYDFQQSYDSEVTGRKLHCKEEEFYWSSHLYLARAVKYAQGEVAESLQAKKDELFGYLKDRVKQAEAADRAAAEQLIREQNARFAEADRLAEKMYADGIQRLDRDYQTRLAVLKGDSDVEQLQQAQAFFAAHRDYKDCNALVKQCKDKITAVQEAEKARKKAKNKKIALTAVVAVVLVIAIIIGISLPDRTPSEEVVAAPSNEETQAVQVTQAQEAPERSPTVSQSTMYEQAKFLLECADNRSQDGVEMLKAVGIDPAVYSTDRMDAETINCEILIEQLKQWNVSSEAAAVSSLLDAGLTTDAQIASLAYRQYVLNTESSGAEPQTAAAYRYSDEDRLVLAYLEGAKQLFAGLEGYMDSNDMASECIYQQALIMLDTGVVDQEKIDEAYALLEPISDYPAAADLLSYFTVQPVSQVTVESGVTTNILYYYDSFGRCLGQVEPGEEYVYNTYNEQGQLVEINAQEIGGSGYTETREYSDEGYLIHAVRIEGDDSNQRHNYTYNYNSDGTVRDYSVNGDWYRLEYTYDANGRVSEDREYYSNNRQWGNSLRYTTQYTYDAAGLLVEENIIRHTFGMITATHENNPDAGTSAELSSVHTATYTYTYDEDGNLVKEEYVDHTSAFAYGYVTTYTYGMVYAPDMQEGS